MNPLQYTNAGALLLAAEIQSFLALAVVSLYKAGTIVLGPTTTKTELEAEEADFTGYAVNTVTAWLDPALAEGGGASIDSGLLDFPIAAPYTVPNVIQGWWVEDAGGGVCVAGDFPVNKGLVGAGDTVRFNIELVLFG